MESQITSSILTEVVEELKLQKLDSVDKIEQYLYGNIQIRTANFNSGMIFELEDRINIERLQSLDQMEMEVLSLWLCRDHIPQS